MSSLPRDMFHDKPESKLPPCSGIVIKKGFPLPALSDWKIIFEILYFDFLKCRIFCSFVKLLPPCI